MGRRQKQKIMVHFFIFATFFIGILLGLYGQGLAYFLNEKVYTAIYPIHYLIASTITSISMFLVSLLFVYVAAKKKVINKTISSRYAWSIFITGFFISCWSMFVLVMWWG
ncbi:MULTISPECIES: hypothetical protein [Clostridia]|uniref:hypothetical protein n=1 Tax=Clostridia TaxID=186801 RepID=UPI000EA377D0|nr:MULTISPECIES: hypothetical protein [Clostridia]NBJ71541.1 hypothetical protein [Roseburia sp. 1XD42-34]RKI74210.1 hypothetical protein D7V87_19180 [Clostridium sp. 1xD42-85]